MADDQKRSDRQEGPPAGAGEAPWESAADRRHGPSPSAANAANVAMVTGGARGIGRAVVEALLGTGYRVYFGSRSQDSVADALAELRPRFGDRVAGRPLDVRRQEQVDAFAGWMLAEAGRIDCLVNNAGLGIFGPVFALSGDQWREVLETNLSGAFYCIRAVAGRMKEQGGGWIFNVASLAAKSPLAGGAAYNASKYGMLGLSEAAMLDLRHFGVRVATILPGSVDTGFGHPARRGGDRSWMLAPADVAATILHLLSYPDRALPSLVEIRPTRPPQR
jgi:3-oxoacyl-[acyl-carrier protein] reductase